jgi:fatty-acyl-CoA synthase
MQLTAQDWIAKWAVYSPDRVAVSEYESGRSLTYAQLQQKAEHLCHWLRDTHRLQSGDRVAVLAENCLEYVVLFSVAQKTGIILVPLNYRLAPTEITYLITDSQPALIIYEEELRDLLQPQIDLPTLPLNELERILERAPQKNKPFPVTKLPGDHPAFILYTSGTTGFPKGAIYSYQMLFWNSINTAMSLIVNSESRTINCMPPFHTGGWNVLLTPFLHHGGYTCLMKKFDPGAVLHLMRTERPTLFMGVPTMLKMIADQPAFAEANLSSLYYIIVGGEPMPIPLIERWHEKDVFIRQGYGMTEVGPNLTSLHQRDAIRKKGSIGRPNFYVQIRIVDPGGKEVPANQPGELLLKGPMVTPGYWQNPGATAKALHDGWFHTGDMVRQDEEGYLYVVDRIKNMFISGGENVYPAEVERALLQHPDIRAAAVIGIPHEKWGEVGKAFVVTETELTSTDVLEHCSRLLAKFKVPKEIVFTGELPLSPTGKINRKALS